MSTTKVKTQNNVPASIRRKLEGYAAWDHSRVDQIFYDFKMLLAQGQIDEAAAFFELKEGLKRHMLWEEDELFPYYDTEAAYGSAAADPQLTSEIREEHQVISALLERIYFQLLQRKELDKLVKQLTTLLRSHEEKEAQVLSLWSGGKVTV